MSAAALALAAAILLAGRSPVTRIGRGDGRGSTPRRESVSDPLAGAAALDIFAVCLSAGMAVARAARVTASTAPPDLARVLGRAADLLALGADSAVAWSSPEHEAADEQCTALLRLARRSADSGSALAAAVAELAAESRHQATAAASAAAERAGVIIAGPLGLCFLPSFVCLGIVPVVVGLAGDFFTAGLL